MPAGVAGPPGSAGADGSVDPNGGRLPADGTVGTLAADDGPEPVTFKTGAAVFRHMSLAVERDCPDCETSREFYQAASTRHHLGVKEKWHCPECDYGFVTIDGIDTSA